jgi:hypothetical protein
VRWTIGDVSERGFEALRLSILGAMGIFGTDAQYAVCVNTVGVDGAKAAAGDIPVEVEWIDADRLVPAWLREHLDDRVADGVAWKFAPVRLFPDRWEIALDNDCILWRSPGAIERWLSDSAGSGCVLAADVRACFGQFETMCGPPFPPAARNTGIRGLPPGFDLERMLRETLRAAETERGERVVLRSELDEQGWQTAALLRAGQVLTVSLEDVTVCSPFHPHLPHLGRCGAHFVGLNGRHIPWAYFNRPADALLAEHWARHRDALEQNVTQAERRAGAEAAQPVEESAVGGGGGGGSVPW